MMKYVSLLPYPPTKTLISQHPCFFFIFVLRLSLLFFYLKALGEQKQISLPASCQLLGKGFISLLQHGVGGWVPVAVSTAECVLK